MSEQNIKRASKQLSRIKVKSKEDLLELYKTVQGMIALESPSMSSSTIQTTNVMIEQLSNKDLPFPEPPNEFYSSNLQALLSNVRSSKAPKTQEALTKAISWYEFNVGEGDVEKYGLETKGGILKAPALYGKRQKFGYYGLLGGSVLLGAFLIYKAFQPSYEESPSSNPKRRRKQISKGRIKRHRKKKVVMRKNPVLKISNKNLTEYRKKHQAILNRAKRNRR
jgi:hypothetical protein